MGARRGSGPAMRRCVGEVLGACGDVGGRGGRGGSFVRVLWGSNGSKWR